MGEEIQRRAADERDRRLPPQGVTHVGERGLHPECEEDDAGDDGKVEIREGVACELVARFDRLDLGKALCGCRRGDIEVRPPQRGRNRHPHHGRDDDAGVDTCFRADTDRHDRLS